MKRGPLQYLQNLFIGADEEGNAVLAGDPRHTISARTGYAQYRGKAWAKVCGPVINALMGSSRHCIEAAVHEGLVKPEEAAKWTG